jgi:cytochrome c oxidase accessory protein FixG
MTGAPEPDVQVLSTMNADGSRRWLKPKVSPGRFLNRRRVVGYALIAFFCTLPHLRVNDKPPILLDLLHREFTFVGMTLYPTDTLLLALMMLGVLFSIIFLTALFGRVWCGWACPQTVYLELVYRPIERFFVGAPGRKPKVGGWRQPAKLITYLIISFLLANTFIAYFIKTDDLFRWMLGSPLTHPVPFLVMAITTFFMMFDFAFFREQMCIVTCPYGRFQSVMLDRNSLIITYDPDRGEPRGKKRRRPKQASNDVRLKVLPDEPELGDCIDCKMCVTTCPTGIDIRDGLQLECVNCAQCIDACDSVMEKIGKPRGLIRYGSQAAVLDKIKGGFLRPRTVIYPAFIAVLLAGFLFVLLTRSAAYVSVIRQRGAPFALVDGDVVNAVTLKVQNRTPDEAVYSFSLPGVESGAVEIPGEPFAVGSRETVSRPVRFVAPLGSFAGGARDIVVRISDGHGFEHDIKYRMMAPAPGRQRAARQKAEEERNGE